jgi:hypothetical protein
MTVIMTLRNPLSKSDYLQVYIEPNLIELSHDWQAALKKEIDNKSYLEKNFVWHGWPDSLRDLNYLCDQLNRHIQIINQSNINYHIDLNVTPESVEVNNHNGVNHDIMNVIHNHFEILQGTVDNLSSYYYKADIQTKYSIRQLNNICHEIESLCLSLRKKYHQPYWMKPSQVTTFLNAKRYRLNKEHRKGFVTNKFNRRFGHVYMHWSQIGKTLYEVYRDEKGADIDKTVCDAITHLSYYSGNFNIEWGRDTVYGNDHPYHTKEMDSFNDWLRRNNFDVDDASLSLGYLELAKVNLKKSFGTEDVESIWKMISERLDIYSIECLGSIAYYDYTCMDSTYEQQQIDFLTPGYLTHV